MLSNNRTSRTFTRSPLALAIGAALAFASSAAMAATVVDTPPDLSASKAFSTNGEVAPHLRNASRTPSQASTKSKLEALPIYVAARKADGTLIEGAAKVHPMVITYTDRHKSVPADDVFAAVSLDDGATWKHMNLSRSADKTTDFMVRKDDDVLVDGAKLTALGDVRKPSLKVDGNFILVSWTSKLCRSGDPTDIGDGADPYQVKGSQGGVDYGATYERPDLGVVPFSCLWVARGVIETDGAIKWFVPEQITSGRRDALQDVPFSAKDKGFALVWQEDPVGLDPGKPPGPAKA